MVYYPPLRCIKHNVIYTKECDRCRFDTFQPEGQSPKLAPTAEPAPAPLTIAQEDAWLKEHAFDHASSPAGQPTAAPEDATTKGTEKRCMHERSPNEVCITCIQTAEPAPVSKKMLSEEMNARFTQAMDDLESGQPTAAPEDATTRHAEDCEFQRASSEGPEIDCTCGAKDATTGAREQDATMLKKLADELQNAISDGASIAQEYRTLLEYLSRAYSVGQTFCTAHAQVYERVQVLEKMYREADNERRELRNRVVVLEPQAEALEGELAAASEQVHELEARIRELETNDQGRV